MSFPPYPAYKDSGVEWLGEIPAHWDFGTIRHFASMRTGHTPSRSKPEYWENCEIPWFTLADVWQLRDERQRYLGETAQSISRIGLEHSAAELLPRGTVVFSRTASVGFSGIMPSPMATSQDFWNWIPKPGLESEYLLYLFRAMRQEFERLTMGSTHKTIYQADAGGLHICVPPQIEQDTIAAFLDHETAKIDALVAEYRTLIELLKEKRQAVISHVVTKGLDPTVPMKDSGEEWLGEVPEHWHITSIKHVVTRIDQGWSPQCEAYPVEGDQEWGVLKVGCVNGGFFTPERTRSSRIHWPPTQDWQLAEVTC